MQKVYKLVKTASKIEAGFTNIQKLKIAKKRLMKVANIDESKLEEIKRETLTDKVSEMKEQVITKFDLLQDIKIKAGEEPENETLEQELNNKENDLRFSVEDLVRSEKESNGTDMQDFEAKLKLANLSDPKKYTAITKDMSKESSKPVEDEKFKKNQKEVNTEETPNK